MANDTSKSSNNKQSIDSLKTSGFERRMSIAKTSLNIGRRWAGNSVSGMFLNKEARTARNQAFMEEQATYLATELGKLKGSVVKIGQMLAIYGEHILPPEITRVRCKRSTMILPHYHGQRLNRHYINYWVIS